MSEFVRAAVERIRETATAAVAADESGEFEKASALYAKSARDTVAVLEMPNPDLISAGDRIELARAATSYANRVRELRRKKPIESESTTDLKDDDLLVEKPNVAWDDIIGCDEAKESLKQINMYLKQPQAFLNPPKGCLLYGPPGTGKTTLAKAVATQADTSFILLQPSLLTSKWLGDSEKNMRRVFEVARARAPTIIFIDEADAIIGSREDSTESASVNRMKTEFMTQVDGFATTNQFVFVMAATNFPWKIDDGCMRRLTKSVFVGLPSFNERIDILASMTRLNAFDLVEAANATPFYSGSNLRDITQEAQQAALNEWFRIARWVLRNKMWHGFYAETIPPCCANSKETCDVCTSVYMAPHELPPNTAGRPIPAIKHVMAGIRKIVPQTDQIKLAKYLEWRGAAESPE